MDFNTVGSIVAIIIGLMALGVSVWLGIETRNNYRLSVTPKISFDVNWTSVSETPGISIRNRGIGPAIIKYIEIVYDNLIYKNTQNFQDLISTINIKCEDAGIKEFIFCTPDFNETLSAGEILPFIYLNINDSKDINRIIAFHSVLNGTKIKIEYESIYGEIFFKEDVIT
ncbi:MAG: hypothetical protein C0391_03650 [Anaerolinea sp.]|nr:hypothetical protein [Anaerolinea sp.]